MWQKTAEEILTELRRFGAAHWKKIGAALVCVGVLAGVVAGTKYFVFEIEGKVTQVTGRKVAVVDFITTRVVDFTGSPIDPTRLLPGDEVEIKRNLQGEVFSLELKRPMLNDPRFK